MKHLPYTEKDHRQIVRAYVQLVEAQIQKQKVNKAAMVRTLMEQTGRTRGAIEAKFMNLSAVAVRDGLLPMLPGGYVKGYVPAPNGAAALTPLLTTALEGASIIVRLA